MVTLPSTPERRMSEAEYLAFEAASPAKHEYVLGWVRAFAGANRRHNLVVGNVYAALHDAAHEKGCQAYGSDMRLRVSGELSYYPDVTVVCDPMDTDEMNVTRPCAVVEVLSPGTARIDRGEKLLAYRGMDTLRTYLVVSPDERRVERHWRNEHGAWHSEEVVDRDAVSISCLDLDLPLDTIYAGVQFPPASPI